MDWNIVLILSAIVLLCTAAGGYKKGMVRSIISFVSLIITCIVVALLGSAVKNYFDGELMNVAAMVLLLCLVGIIRRILNLVFFSAKALSDLPIVSWMDKLLGIVVGVFETVLLLWTLYILAAIFELGAVAQILWNNTQSSPILLWIYQHNYLAWVVGQVLAVFRV